jgi:hypothetical protein
MFSPETIRRMSNEAAEKAAKKKKRPYVPYNWEEINEMPPFPFPNLGDYRPKGWEPVGRPYFVDYSGLGGDHEVALSLRQFKIILVDNLQHGYGYAIVEVGQFQVCVQAFRPLSRK